MSRTIRIAFGVILIVVIATSLLLTLAVVNLDRLVERVIEQTGTQEAGVAVAVDRVHISLKEGSGTISGLTIGNPPGFKSGHAIKIGAATLVLNIESLTGDVIIVDSVVIDGAGINYEQTAAGSNLQTILDNLSSDDASTSSGSAEDSGDEIRVIVRRLDFLGATASLQVPALKQDRSVALPDIRLRDIGTDTGGASASELAEQILRPIIEKSLSAAVGASADKFLERGKKKAVEKLFDALER